MPPGPPTLRQVLRRPCGRRCASLPQGRAASGRQSPERRVKYLECGVKYCVQAGLGATVRLPAPLPDKALKVL